MATAGPWSVKGIDPKAREIAKDLARRSGMTLGEWLNQMIIEGGEGEPAPDRAAPEPPPVAAPRRRLDDLYREARARDGSSDVVFPRHAALLANDDGETARVARALEGLANRVETGEHRQVLALSGIDQSVMGVLSRLEQMEQEHATTGARSAGLLAEVRSAQADVAQRLKAVEGGDAARASGLRALEGALARMVERMDQAVVEGEEARAAADAVAQRLERVETIVEAAPAAFADAEKVETVLTRMAERLDGTETRTGAAMQSLQASFANLDARLRASEARTVAMPGAEVERRFNLLAQDLVERVDASRAELAQGLREAADGRIEKMETVLRDLGGRMDHAEKRSAQAIDRLGREVVRVAHGLDERASASERRSAELSTSVAERLERLDAVVGEGKLAAAVSAGDVARMADVMETRLRHADSVQAEALEKLGAEIERIAERLSERVSTSDRRAAEAVDEVSDRLEKLGARVDGGHEDAARDFAERIRASEARTVEMIAAARARLEGHAEAPPFAPVAHAPIATPPPAQAAEVEASPANVEASASGIEDAPTPEPLEPDEVEAASRPEAHQAPEPSPEPAPEPTPSNADPFGVADFLSDEPYAPPPIPLAKRSVGAAAAAAGPPGVLEASEDASGTDGDAGSMFDPDDDFVSAPAFASSPSFGEIEADAPVFDATSHTHHGHGFHEAPTPAFAHAGGYADPLDAPAFGVAGSFAGEALSSYETAPPPLATPDEGASFSVSDFAPEAELSPGRRSTRELLDGAREAARRAAVGKGEAGGPAGAIPAPAAASSALSALGSRAFSFGLGKRKKETAPTLRTFVLASGVAGSITAMGVGAYLMGGSHGVAAPDVASNSPGALAPSAAPSLAVAMTPPLLSRPAKGAVQTPVAPSPSATAAASPPPAVAQSHGDAGAEPAPAEPAHAKTTRLSASGAKALYTAAVARLDTGDLTAVADVRRAAEAGDPSAQFYLARLYDGGADGLHKDTTEARRWTEKAAHGGDPSAMYNLASYLYAGDGGTKDAAQAADWFRKAAERGVVNGQYNLAQLYEKGYGVPQNLADAYKWYLVAAGAGDSEARTAAIALKPRLNPDAAISAEKSAALARANLTQGVQTASAAPARP